MNESIADRLKSLREHLSLTKKEFAALMGVDNSQYSKIESGILNITVTHAMELCSNTNVNFNWILTGKGDMLRAYDSIENKSLQTSEPELSVYGLRNNYFGIERQRIPLYELDASAGLNTLFSSQNTYVPLDYITVPNAPKCDGALFVRGDSMYPILKAGDIVCYKTISSLDNLIFGEMYVLDIDNGDDEYLTVKFVQKSEKGDKYIKLVSENKHHEAKNIPLKQIRAMAIIKLSIRYNTIS